MKKLFLIFTFLIYSLSIFSETGLFIRIHAETVAVVALSDISSDRLSANDFQDENESSHCAEESCHVGHCHHVSILSNHNIYPQHLQQVINGKLNLLSYQNPFLEGLKRPPKHI